MNIKHIYFDVANTLLHKPIIWSKFASVLTRNGFEFNESDLQINHKLFSEFIKFPDRTDEKFYNYFNYFVNFNFCIIKNYE